MARILCNVAGGGKPLKGNAEPGDVLAGKTFSNKQSNALTGSMPNNGAWSASTSGSGSVTIPAGYHNGSGGVDCSGAYNAGVAAADARVNTSSASYNQGYTNGQASVKFYQYEYNYPYWLSVKGGQMQSITINVQSGLNGVSVAFVSAWDSGRTNGGAAMDFSYDKTSGALTISTSLNLNHPTFRVTGYYF